MRISDWSSDVCSSDLEAQLLPKRMGDHQYVGKQDGAVKGKTSERLKCHLGSGGAVVHKLQKSTLLRPQRSIFGQRSEARRVGKECVSTCRSRWSPYH